MLSRAMSVSEAQKPSRRDLKVAFGAALAAQMEKNAPARQETGVWFLGHEDPLEKTMQLTPAFLPGDSHGQRSLGGATELDPAERLSLREARTLGLSCQPEARASVSHTPYSRSQVGLGMHWGGRDSAAEAPPPLLTRQGRAPSLRISRPSSALHCS